MVDESRRECTHVDRASKAALGSIVVVVVVLALKYAAYRLTGSVALY